MKTAVSLVVIGAVLASAAVLAGEMRVSPRTVAEVSQAEARETAEVTLRVAGITCASCAYIVKTALSDVAGVHELSLIETEDPTVLLAVVTYDRALVSGEALAATTSDIGYPTEVVADHSS
jgi:mercuric ion binding protein